MDKKFRVGIVVFISVVLIGLSLFVVGKFKLLNPGYTFGISFQYADNIEPGAAVKISGGVKIGYVEKLVLGTNGVVVIVRVSENIKINRDATFHLYSTSMIGTRYIDILHYTGNPPYIKPGEVVKGETPLGINRAFEMLGKAAIALGEFARTEEGETFSKTIEKLLETVNNLYSALENVEAASGDIRLGLKRINRILKKTEETVDEIRQIASTMRRSVKEKELQQTIENLEAITTQLKGLLAFLQNPKTRKSISKTIKNLEEFSEKIKRRPSLLFFSK